MSSDHYLHWSVGPPKRFKPGGVKPEANWWINLGSSEMAKEHDDACTIADHFDCVACPFGSQLGTEIRCRADMSAGGGSGGVAGPNSAACQRDERDARGKLERDWARYNAAQKRQCAGFAALDRAPSYVELLTCLELAKQTQELPPDSKVETVGRP